MNEQKWLRRIIFLETVAGVPGMVSHSLSFGLSRFLSVCPSLSFPVLETVAGPPFGWLAPFSFSFPDKTALSYHKEVLFFT